MSGPDPTLRGRRHFSDFTNFALRECPDPTLRGRRRSSERFLAFLGMRPDPTLRGRRPDNAVDYHPKSSSSRPDLEGTATHQFRECATQCTPRPDPTLRGRRPMRSRSAKFRSSGPDLEGTATKNECWFACRRCRSRPDLEGTATAWDSSKLNP